MLFRQYLDREPVVAVSYLFGCPTKGIGAVLDLIGDPERYLKESEAGDLPIKYVIETHMHADHISSGRELAEAAGAEYAFFAGTEANYSFRGLEDGEVLDMGNTQVEVLHTPGHTPEHISLVVTDHAGATSRGSCSPATRSWWGTWAGPSSRPRQRKGQRLSSRAPYGFVVFPISWR